MRTASSKTQDLAMQEGEAPGEENLLQAPILFQQPIGAKTIDKNEPSDAHSEEVSKEDENENVVGVTPVETSEQKNLEELTKEGGREEDKDKGESKDKNDPREEETRTQETTPASLIQDILSKGKEKEKDKKKNTKRPQRRIPSSDSGGNAPTPSFFKAMKRHLRLETENFQKAVHANQWADPSLVVHNTLFFFSPLGTTPKDLKGHNILAACAGQWGLTEDDIKVIGTHPKGRSIVLYSPQRVAEILGNSGITSIRIMIKVLLLLFLT